MKDEPLLNFQLYERGREREQNLSVFKCINEETVAKVERQSLNVLPNIIIILGE